MNQSQLSTLLLLIDLLIVIIESDQEASDLQVERLSGMIETPPERMDDKLRLSAINSTVNIDARLTKLYEVIENDLLGKLQFSANYISPYKVRPPCTFFTATM